MKPYDCKDDVSGRGRRINGCCETKAVLAAGRAYVGHQEEQETQSHGNQRQWAKRGGVRISGLARGRASTRQSGVEFGDKVTQKSTIVPTFNGFW